jgi:cytochrome c biogenesis protein CcdA
MLTSLPLLTGFAGALTHVLTGPDHLAAVTPFAFEEKKKAWKIGLFWGTGHLTGMLLIGIAFYFFRKYFELEKFSSYSEYSVGFILSGIGIWAIYKAFRPPKHRKEIHIHENHEPYLHSHENGELHHHHAAQKKVISETYKIKNENTSFGVGTVHGFAGIAHFILFLPVLGFTNEIQTVAYIIGFAIGTIFAMVSYTFILSKISQYLNAEKINKRMKYLRILSGILAIAIGIYWIIGK